MGVWETSSAYSFLGVETFSIASFWLVHPHNFQAVIDGLAERRRDVALLEQDMTEIVTVIDEHLSHLEDDPTQDVSTLADRYQAALAKHLTAQQGSI